MSPTFIKLVKGRLYDPKGRKFKKGGGGNTKTRNGHTFTGDELRGRLQAVTRRWRAKGWRRKR